MKTILTKFDVLSYVESVEKGITCEELLKAIRMNARFAGVSGRMLSERIKELKKAGFVAETHGRVLHIDTNSKEAENLLAFIHWAKMHSADYNGLLEENVSCVFRAVFEENCRDVVMLRKKTTLSKPTLFNAIKILERSNFVTITKRKPLHIEANFNDMTFFYALVLRLSFREFEKKFVKSISEFNAVVQKINALSLIDKMVALHTYSTTVTEGNTASEKQVEEIITDRKVSGLTPREITEILNTKGAVDKVMMYAKGGEELTLDRIKKLHGILMNTLIDSAGEIYYRRKRIIGSKLKPPESKSEINICLKAMFNFIANYEEDIDAAVLGCIAHFMFVTVHPFQDGNGRIARLLHSWVYLRHGLPLFVFDPEKRNIYFGALEKGREKSIDEFVVFCLDEMRKVIENPSGM